MDEYSKVFLGGDWSWEENKMFELALAMVDEDEPGRWEVVADMVGGKSAEEVEKHYSVLVEDLLFIESGEFDHMLIDLPPWNNLVCTQAACWSDEDHKNNLSSPFGSD